jgi:hypothetical protein
LYVSPFLCSEACGKEGPTKWEDALSPSNELARYRRRSSGAAALRSSGIFESARGIERMCAFDNSAGNTELSG